MKHTSSLDSSLSTVRTEGGLLPADILAKILAGDGRIPGTTAEDYHLPKGEKLNESINRAWSRVRALWEKFRLQRESLTETDTGTSQTRETLLLPLFAELGYGRLFSSKAEDRTVGDKVFSISHFWHHSPIHLVGCQVELDRKAKGVRGAAQSSPHSMVQDFLNRSKGHLWGFCSNGLRLRILRDNQSLSRQAFIEFDLESMFEGEVFSDFALLWLLCHQSRVESDDTATCWLEIWARSAQEQGVRALDTLRDSVRKTIEILGQGFLEHHNPDLKDRLRSGALSRQDYFRQLLRLVYRLLFLFAAEDRGLLHATGTPENARQRYEVWHSTARLRRLATKLAGTKHHDLYECLKLIMHQLGSENGCPELGLSPLGSFLWSDEALPDLAPARLSNEHLLRAVRALSFMEAEGLRRPVDFKNVGARELGSIYESLLELHPDLDTVSGAFSLQTAAGNERKTTGSYYTPTALINSLLDSALEPVAAKATAQVDPERALLELKICDPACGSGHFLIAAAHRLAKRLAGVRTGDEEPGPDAIRKALRDVIGRCIYGVDINPMAVELCKVSLWLEALEPGKPLSFLDHHIRCGNSLIGATPELIAGGLPDEAFKPIEGDEKAACSALKKKNKAAQEKHSLPFLVEREKEVQARLREAAAALEAIPSDSLKDIHAKELAFRQHESTPEFQSKLILAHAWCAAFVIRKYFPPKPGYPNVPADEPVGITQRELNSLAMGQTLKQELKQEVERLAAQYQFFHWHLAYPEVFARSGFDVMIGNPPWDTISPDAKEFFSVYDSTIRFIGKDGQEEIINNLLQDATINDQWNNYRRGIYSAMHFIKCSGRYRLFAEGSLGKGDFNIFRMFVELSLGILKTNGYVAQIVPEGFYNGANSTALRLEIFSKFKLHALYGFENKHEVWFPNVHTAMKFCLYAAEKHELTTVFSSMFNISSHEQLAHVQHVNCLKMPIHLVAEFSPETMSIMELNDQKAIDIAQKMYSRWPKFGDESHGHPTRHYMRELDMGNDRDIFTEDRSGLPLYEGRMVDQYDYRAKGYRQGRGRASIWEQLSFNSAEKTIQPQWWIRSADIPERLRGRVMDYRIGFCKVASPTNERSLVAALLPPGVVAGDKVPTITFQKGWEWAYMLWLACANSFAMDFIVRKKISLSMTHTIVDSLPFPRIGKDHPIARKLVPLALQLSCSGPEMTAYWEGRAKEGWPCTDQSSDSYPGETRELERIKIKSIIDAIVAKEVFGLSISETEYLLDTFPLQARQETLIYGKFLSRYLILKNMAS